MAGFVTALHTTPGETLGWGEYDETMLQFEAFGEAVKANRPAPGLLREAYNASVASLLGETAMEQGQTLAWPAGLAFETLPAAG